MRCFPVRFILGPITSASWYEKGAKAMQRRSWLTAKHQGPRQQSCSCHIQCFPLSESDTLRASTLCMNAFNILKWDRISGSEATLSTCMLRYAWTFGGSPWSFGPARTSARAVDGLLWETKHFCHRDIGFAFSWFEVLTIVSVSGTRGLLAW